MRIAYCLRNSARIRFYYRIMQAEVIRNHDNENVRHIGLDEAQHREHKRLKLGGCQTQDRSDV
jgi:hypothetical protein